MGVGALIGIAASVDAQRRKATLATYGDGCGVTQLSRYAQRKLRVAVFFGARSPPNLGCLGTDVEAYRSAGKCRCNSRW